MKPTNFIQLNKLSILHNNSTIFFCKTDFLLDDFLTISKLPHTVTLISGNSDYAITDDIIQIAPKNIIAWYAQNALSNSNILHALPIGLENKEPAIRNGHGVGYYDRSSERENILTVMRHNSNPSKFIYANFNISTNITYRYPIKHICLTSKHIDWEEPNLSLSDLYSRYQDYKMILCPAGNGIDTHRLWEALYCNKVPITIKTGNYNIYNLYKQLPIIVLDNIEQLNDKQYIIEKYDSIINTKFDMSMLDIEYWKSKILQIRDSI